MTRVDDRIPRVLDQLDQWIDSNGWAGFDVSDVKSLPVYRRIELASARSRVARAVLKPPVVALERFAPDFARRVWRVKPKVYAQAIGLMARGHLAAFRANGRAAFLAKAADELDWLIANRSSYEVWAWGQPFDWPSLKVIPAGTPRATVTSIVMNALMDGFEATGRGDFLETVRRAADTLAERFHRSVDADGDVCLSYTTVDEFRIHNANMLAAAALVRASRLTRDDDQLELGMSASRFTMKHQRSDGAWTYWAPPFELGKIDNYHTGFVLESLGVIRRNLGQSFPWTGQYLKGIDFFMEQLIEDDGTPKMTPDSPFPIDVQSCAQTILTLVEISDSAPERRSQAEQRLGRVVTWTLDNMYEGDGRFAYRIYRGGRIDRTPYLRWGQSWMLRALGSVLEHQRSDRSGKRAGEVS